MLSETLHASLPTPRHDISNLESCMAIVTVRLQALSSDRCNVRIASSICAKAGPPSVAVFFAVFSELEARSDYPHHHHHHHHHRRVVSVDRFAAP